MVRGVLEGLAKDLTMPVAGIDREGRLFFANHALRDLVGETGGVALGRPFWELIPEPDGEYWREGFLERMATGIRRELETPLITRDGHASRITWHTIPLFDDTGRFESAFVLGTNVTALREAESRLERLNRLLEALSVISGIALRAEDPHTLLQDACQRLVDVGCCEAAWVVLVGDDGIPVGVVGVPAVGTVFANDVLQERVRLQDCHLVRPTGSGDAIAHGDVQACSDCPFGWHGSGAHGVSVAIRHGDALLGVLIVHLAEPSRPAILRVLGNIADNLGFALAALEARAAHERTERSLAAQTRMLDSFFTSSLDAAAIMDDDFNFVRVNTAYAHADGREPEYYIGRNHFELFPNEENLALFTRVRDSGEPYWIHAKPFVYAGNPERGTTWWDWSLVPLLDDDGEVAMLSLWLRDVTVEQRAVQELEAQRDQLDTLVRERTAELQSSNELLNSLVAHSPIAIMMNDRDGNVMHWNEAAERITGWPAEEVIGRFSPLPQPEHEESARALFAQVLAGSTLAEVPIRRRRRDGREVDLLLSAAPVKDSSGKVISVVGLFHDETERIQMEQALERTTELLRAIVDASPLGIAAYDLEGKVTFWNQAAERILGRSSDEVVGVQPPTVPPEMLPFIIEGMRKSGAGEPLDAITFESLCRDGSRIEVELHGAPLHDAQGQSTGSVVLFGDVTEREAAAREREELLRQLEEERATLYTLVRNAPAGIVLCDAQGRLLLVNPAAEAIHKRPAPIGGDCERHGELRFCHADGTPYDVGDLPLIRAALRGEVVHTTDLAVVWPDGQQRDLDASTAPIRTGDGEITGAVGIFWDVSEERATERERDRLLTMLEDYASHLEEMVADRTRELAASHNELRQQRDFVDAVVENAGSLVVVVDPRGRVVRFNAACERTTGYAAGDVQGRSFTRTLIPKGDRKRVRADIQQAVEREWGQYEGKWQCRDGSLRTVSWQISTIRGNEGEVAFIIGTGWDVTRERAAEHALRDSEEKYRELVESARSAIVHWDLDGTLRFVNEYGLHLFGYRPEELIGDNVSVLVPRTDRNGNDLTGLVSAIIESPADFWMNENENIAKDGTCYWISWSNRLVRDDEGTPVGIMAVGVDRTEQKAAEEQLEASRQHLRDLAAEVAQVEQRERRQIATLLHDNVGQLLAFGKLKLRGMLQRGEYDAEGLEEMLRYVDEAIEETRSLTSQLSPAALEQLGFVAALQWLADEFTQRHRVKVSFECAQEPESIADELAITLFEATRELITNVVKHAEAGQVIVRLGVKDTWVWVEVADDGVGFEADVLPRSNRRDGGFGLSNVRERITYLGGDLEIVSTPGTGTTVTIICPLVLKESRA